jgi:hypothetical protein
MFFAIALWIRAEHTLDSHMAMMLMPLLFQKYHLGKHCCDSKLYAMNALGREPNRPRKLTHRGHNLDLMSTERLRAIYPTLTDKELAEAAENLRRYFACALQIAREADPAPVDSTERPGTIKERSSSSLNKIPLEHG